MATVQTTQAAAAKPVEGPRRRSRRLLLVLVVVALLVVVAGGWWYLHRKVAPAVVRPGPIVSLPTLTVDLADGHLLQLDAALQTTSATDQKRLQLRQPRLLDATIATLGAYRYAQLLSAAGRAGAKHSLLVAYNAALAPSTPPVALPGEAGAAALPQVSTVYFTRFVMQ